MAQHTLWMTLEYSSSDSWVRLLKTPTAITKKHICENWLLIHSLQLCYPSALLKGISSESDSSEWSLDHYTPCDYYKTPDSVCAALQLVFTHESFRWMSLTCSAQVNQTNYRQGERKDRHLLIQHASLYDQWCERTCAWFPVNALFVSVKKRRLKMNTY